MRRFHNESFDSTSNFLDPKKLVVSCEKNSQNQKTKANNLILKEYDKEKQSMDTSD